MVEEDLIVFDKSAIVVVIVNIGAVEVTYHKAFLGFY